MATPNQIAANRANSQKSTGPKTEAGKEASSRNRLSHGFSSNATLIAGEDPEEFTSLIMDFMVEYQPATPTEQILVEKMALNQWLSLRAFHLQGNAFKRQMMSADRLAIPKDLGLLIRYKTAADNAFLKAHAELAKAQKERKKSEIGFVPQTASHSPAPRPEPAPPTSPDTPEVVIVTTAAAAAASNLEFVAMRT